MDGAVPGTYDVTVFEAAFPTNRKPADPTASEMGSCTPSVIVRAGSICPGAYTVTVLFAEFATYK
jgi:uracil-DNA glycosylase